MVFEHIWRDPDLNINNGKQWNPFSDNLSAQDMNYIVSNLNYVADNINLFASNSSEALRLANEANRLSIQASEDVQISINASEEALIKSSEALKKINDVIISDTGSLITIDGEVQSSWSADFVENERLKTINLFDYKSMVKYNTTAGISGTIGNKVTTSYSSTRAVIKVPIEELNDYTISSDNLQFYCAIVGEDGETETGLVSGTWVNNFTFMTTQGTKYLIAVVRHVGDSPAITMNSIVDNHIQLEKGNVATLFQPYNGEIAHNGDKPITFAESERLKNINLLYFKDYTVENYGIVSTTRTKEQTITINGTSTAGADWFSSVNNVLPIKNYIGKEITISTTIISGSTSGNIEFYICPSDEPFYSGVYSSQLLLTPNVKKAEKTFTVSTNKQLDCLRFYTPTGTVITNLVIKVQIEENNKATDWQYPYGTITHNYDKSVTFAEEERLKTVNLLPFPYTDGIKTINGITFKPNSDGSITISGTATANAYFTIGGNFNLKAGTYHNSFMDSNKNPLPDDSFVLEIYGNMSTQYFGGNQAKQVPDITNAVVLVIIKPGASVNGTYYPQLERGEIGTDYHAHNGAITHNGDKPIVFAESERLKGKNLFKVNNSIGYSTTRNGVTITVNNDYTLLLNGTSTSECWLDLFRGIQYDASWDINKPIVLNRNKTYSALLRILSGNTSGSNLICNISIRNSSGAGILSGQVLDCDLYSDSLYSIVTNTRMFELNNGYLYLPAGVSFYSLNLGIMVCEGEDTNFQSWNGAIVHENDITPDVLYDIDEKSTIGNFAYNDGIKIGTEVYEDFGKYREVIIYSERGGTVLRTVVNVNNISETSYTAIGIDYGFNYLIIHSFIITKERLMLVNGGYMYISWDDVLVSEDSSSANKIIRIEGFK